VDHEVGVREHLERPVKVLVVANAGMEIHQKIVRLGDLEVADVYGIIRRRVEWLCWRITDFTESDEQIRFFCPADLRVLLPRRWISHYSWIG